MRQVRYVEAFHSLGYEVRAPRTDWTADSSTGVCLTLWKREIDWSGLVMDSRVHGGPIEEWTRKPGNRRRIQHAKRAPEEFDGWVDVVLVSGNPGESYGDAAPWVASERLGKRWRVTYLDDSTGHIAVQAL